MINGSHDTKMPPQTLTVEDAAKELGIGRSLAYELARTGQLPILRLGRRMVVPKAALERFLDGAHPRVSSPSDSATPAVDQPRKSKETE